MTEIEGGGKKKRSTVKSAHRKTGLKRKTIKRVGLKRATRSTRLHASSVPSKSVLLAARRVLTASRALDVAVSRSKHAAISRKPGTRRKRRVVKA